ncbi:MAG: aminoacyl-tRNA hydrolase [Magnetovibrionaceae bacterium]
MQLFVGLGNPGDKYENNRHNVGFMVVDEIARAYSFGPFKKNFQGLIADGRVGSERLLLLKPTTYMNESGRSVRAALDFYKLSAEDVTVFHDELDLGGGKVRIKRGGGHGGHNGLRSLDAHIGKDYQRVRIGVGHPGTKDRVVGHVLADFAKADKAWLAPLVDEMAREAGALAAGDGAGLMNRLALRLNPILEQAAKAKAEKQGT